MFVVIRSLQSHRSLTDAAGYKHSEIFLQAELSCSVTIFIFNVCTHQFLSLNHMNIWQVRVWFPSVFSPGGSEVIWLWACSVTSSQVLDITQTTERPDPVTPVKHLCESSNPSSCDTWAGSLTSPVTMYFPSGENANVVIAFLETERELQCDWKHFGLADRCHHTCRQVTIATELTVHALINVSPQQNKCIYI